MRMGIRRRAHPAVLARPGRRVCAHGALAARDAVPAGGVALRVALTGAAAHVRAREHAPAPRPVARRRDEAARRVVGGPPLAGWLALRPRDEPDAAAAAFVATPAMA